MDAARPALFRFTGSAAAPVKPSPSIAAPEPAVSQEVRSGSRAVAPWRGPVLACGVTIAATAGLAYAVLSPEQGRRATASAPATADRGVILTCAEEPVARESDPDAVDADGSPALSAPVVPALHVWDGRPVRAVPTDTLPDGSDSTGGVIRSGGINRAGGATSAAAWTPAPQVRAVNAAVWLTGEIAD